jgi:hypothetical protein
MHTETTHVGANSTDRSRINGDVGGRTQMASLVCTLLSACTVVSLSVGVLRCDSFSHLLPFTLAVLPPEMCSRVNVCFYFPPSEGSH